MCVTTNERESDNMSRPTQRLDTTEDSTAYRVASLLRQSAQPSTRDTDTHSLRHMTSQIEEFLSVAPQVPPVRMEPEWTSYGENEEEAQDDVLQRDGQPVVQLNVVAGVLEETDPVDERSGIAHLGGVLLPTAENQRELHRRKAAQAQAMLNLMSALSPSPEGNPLGNEARGAVGGPASEVKAEPNSDLSTRVLRHPSSASDDEDEVAVMDADDLNDEDTSDEEEMPARRYRIQEMN